MVLTCIFRARRVKIMWAESRPAADARRNQQPTRLIIQSSTNLKVILEIQHMMRQPGRTERHARRGSTFAGSWDKDGKCEGYLRLMLTLPAGAMKRGNRLAAGHQRAGGHPVIAVLVVA